MDDMHENTERLRVNYCFIITIELKYARLLTLIYCKIVIKEMKSWYYGLQNM